MQVYVARRLLLFVPTLVGASLMIFILMRLVPGDIAQILVYQTGSEQSAVQEKQIRQIRAELGLDRPVIVQYLVWLRDAVRLDFGESYSQRRPVRDILVERFPRSMRMSRTGRFWLYDSPKSSQTASRSHARNCTSTGWSSPSSTRICWICFSWIELCSEPVW